jgi:hypothetical protein
MGQDFLELGIELGVEGCIRPAILSIASESLEEI